MSNSTTARRWLLAGAVALLTSAVAGAVGSALLASRARGMAIDLVERRFGRRVEIGQLRLQVFPRAMATGQGLVVHQRPGADLPPFISIDRFEVDVDLLTLLISRPLEIDRVELEGLSIHVPPGRDDAAASGGERSDMADEPAPAFVIHEVHAPNTRLAVHGEDPTAPLVWTIRTLDLRSAGTTAPMVFDATLWNAKPPGLIQTTGRFGPWRRDDLAGTAVRGRYTFERADLSVFKGLRGTLSSAGRFTGVLGRLDVEGHTDTPDFALDLSGAPVPLRTTFVAVVDGTSGDTRLDPVRATLGRTSLLARGGIVHRTGRDGKTIDLDVVLSGGRLADLLRLGMPSATPFMTGGIDLKMRLRLPQGDRDVIDKLRLEGSFRIGAATFARPQVQKKVNDLSSRSRGEPKHPQRVASDFGGDFTLASASVSLPNLSFHVPGATVELHGTYGLKSKAIDLAGALHMDATLSETTTGFKSFLLMLVEPFFRDDRGHGSRVPIAITGTFEHPDIGLDLGGHDRPGPGSDPRR